MDRDSYTVCPKHGNLGEPRCPKCWKALCDFLSKKNTLLISEDGNMIND